MAEPSSKKHPTTNDWLVQMDDLQVAAETLLWALEFVVESAPVGHLISLGFLRKSTNTHKAIRLLAREGLYEECQILARAVFELRVTFECFVDMLRNNPGEACGRVIDAMMLEKIKQLESVDYYPDASEDIRPASLAKP